MVKMTIKYRLNVVNKINFSVCSYLLKSCLILSMFSIPMSPNYYFFQLTLAEINTKYTILVAKIFHKVFHKEMPK